MELIHSLLDNDLYKFTMQQVVLHHFPSASVEYRFACRTSGADLTPHIGALKKAVNDYCRLSLRPKEAEFLKSQRYIKSSYVDFLSDLRLNPNHISINADPTRRGGIDICVKGPWFHTILFEVPLLAMVNELAFASAPTDQLLPRLEAKAAIAQGAAASGFKFSDFGTRRRRSLQWHAQMAEILAKRLPGSFVGTSNVQIAMDRGLMPVGTMAHEYLQACQVLGENVLHFQRFAFQTWAEEFRGDLGIALSDTVGIDAFLKDFDMFFCKLFDGARHDSGDPFDWGRKLISHYKANRVDPKTKTLVFSDGLDIPKAIALHKEFKDQTNPVFGIGTNLTNDGGDQALNIVVKMTSCNGQPVAKISDSPGKAMCEDPDYLSYLGHVFNIPSERLEAPGGSATPARGAKP